jgi:hypothetical protein
MIALRLYDAQRRPPNWIDMIQPHQFVAFASDQESGSPVDAEGRAFASTDDVSCLVFESLAEARAFCEERAARHETVRYEIFDARGRVDEPLLLIVSPSRAGRLEGSHRMIQLRKRIAIGLFVGAPPLIYYDYHLSDGSLVLPTFLALSMILSGLRLLFMNSALRDAQRRQQERLRQYE